MRWLSLIAGLALIVIAVAAVTRVEDTREGLIAEVVTLLGAAAGVSLLIYGLAARRRSSSVQRPAASAGPAPAAVRQRPALAMVERSRRDILIGAGGIVLCLILLTGLAITGGLVWAVLGLALLLPMFAGSIYRCVRYLRAGPAPDRTSPTR